MPVRSAAKLGLVQDLDGNGLVAADVDPHVADRQRKVRVLVGKLGLEVLRVEVRVIGRLAQLAAQIQASLPLVAALSLDLGEIRFGVLPTFVSVVGVRDVGAVGNGDPLVVPGGVSMASTERSDPLTRRQHCTIDGNRHGGGGHAEQPSSFVLSLLSLLL